MNRKNWLNIKLILLIVLFIVVSLVFMNYSTLKNFTNEGFSFTNGEIEEHVFSNVEKIEVDSISLPVIIYESDVTEVTIKDNTKSYGFETERSLTMGQEEDTVLIKQQKRPFYLSFITGEIVVEIPKGSVMEYDINNTSGSINLDVISKNNLTAKSVSGSVTIHQGGVKGFVESTSGAVRVAAPFEELNAKSVSGSVRVVGNRASKQLLASSISGSIKIKLEEELPYDLNYSTTSGSVKDLYKNIDYSKSGSATQENSGLKINASTVSGSIKIMDWDN